MNQNIRKMIYELFENDVGPVEIEEKDGIFWNCLDWPNYIKCPLNTELSNLIKIIQEGWCLNPPQIILSILSDFQSLNKWQNIEQIKSFQRGLVKAASSARIWIITNGLNIGSSRIASEAIVNERNWQQSLINLKELSSFSNTKQLNYSFNKQQDLINLNFDHVNETLDDDYSVKRKIYHQKSKNDDLINNFVFTLPIMKSIIIGIIDNNQIDNGPFFYRRLDDIDHPRMDILSGFKYARQSNLLESNIRQCSSKGIDQNHSHFIFVKKQQTEEDDDEQLLALELFYELSYLGAWIMSKNFEKPNNLQQRVLAQKANNMRIPFTGILMQGDLKTAKLCSKYLLKQIPILVLSGTGGFADLISYTYTELSNYIIEQNRKTTTNTFTVKSSINYNTIFKTINQTSSKLNIPDEYLERVLKPSLIRRIKQTFVRESKEIKNYVQEFLDLILECVYYANQEGTEYVTILDLNRTETKLENLNEYILHNYLKCKHTNRNEHTTIRPQDDLNLDLKLSIDWNNYKIAKQLLDHYLKRDYFTIDKSLFLRILTKSNREQFAELFLEFGFKLRSIYTFDTLQSLINKSSKNHLFLLICCQNILGLSYHKGFPLNNLEFIDSLNKLFQMTCNLKNFINLNELTNRYNIEPNCLEQKAIIFFTIWSVFNFNFELTKKLWQFSAYPIHLLLIISKSLITISKFTYDVSLRKQIDEHIQYFNDQVIELLDICYSKSNIITIKIISDQIEHFNNFFVIDIAASIKHHRLIAHQSSQKWLDYRLMNGIHMKHSSFGDLVNSIKIFLCVLFLFPILVWLDYPFHSTLNDDQLKSSKETIDDIDTINLQKTTNEKNDKKIFSIFKNKNLLNNNQLINQIGFNLSSPFQRNLDKKFKLTDINLKDKWLLLVTSPMSKYVFHFINWLFFLVFLSYLVMRPGCGQIILDSILFLYIFIYYIELIRKMIFKYFNYLCMKYGMELIELILITILLVIFINDRLNPFNDKQNYTYFGRCSLLVLLFFAYLKLISVFMPMFNTLAPLSYRIRMMSLHDIKMFIGLIWPFMIGFGIAIEIAFYPDRWLFNDKLTIQSFLHRTVIILFRTPTNELEYSNDNCDNQFKSKSIFNSTHCQVGDYNNFNCNQRGFFSHFYLFIYIFFIKILMLALLHALFNASLLSVEKTTIWHYQRFFLITDFDLNYPLPPPYCIIFYLIDLIRLLILKFNHYFNNKNYYLLKKDNNLKYCNCSDESLAFFWKSNCRELIRKTS